MKNIKNRIIDFGKKHPLFLSFLRFIVFIVNRLKYLYFYVFFRVDENIIVFQSFMGRSYCDSPKALYNYLLSDSKYDNYKFIWFFKDPDKYKYLEKNKNTKVVKCDSKSYYQYFAKSKYWIVNSRVEDFILKKRNQKYIQCWHGTPLKKLGYDINIKNSNAMNSLHDIRKRYRDDAKRYDYMISPSRFCSKKFISAFNLKKLGKENIIIERGYPRNDYLINYKSNDVKKIKQNLGISNDKKVILYAPTFRDNKHDSSLGYTYDVNIDFDYFKNNLTDDYVILFRAHYFIANSFDFSKYNGFIYDVSNYDDINDLYVISDILVTDYSSVFFDFAILKRKMIFYVYDFWDYKNKMRDFYIDLSELPGNIVYSDKELLKEIKSNNFVYSKKYKDFNKKYNYLDDGKSSERVIDNILK